MELSNPKALIGKSIYVAGRFVTVTDAWFSELTGRGRFRGTTPYGSICGGPIHHIGKRLECHPLLNLWKPAV